MMSENVHSHTNSQSAFSNEWGKYDDDGEEEF
jgi:hypothetical protein